MIREFDYFSFISSLLKFSPRQLEGEIKAANFITSFLRNFKVNYHQQYFLAKAPRIKKAVLRADDVNVPCQGSCFVSGSIIGKESLISSLIPSRFFLERANINFNPECKGISLSNFYFAPALAVAHGDLRIIMEARKVKGEVLVSPEIYKTSNILVGNIVNPQVICFAHYDSINAGAVDNASGVAVMAKLIRCSPATLKHVLYVFSAQEELSYEKPVYWGRGFRIFEKEYFNLLKKAKKTIAIDCVGNGVPHFTNNLETLRLAFPINSLGKFQKKIFTVHGDIEKLMKVYHSNLDNVGQLNTKFLNQASSLILKKFYAN